VEIGCLYSLHILFELERLGIRISYLLAIEDNQGKVNLNFISQNYSVFFNIILKVSMMFS